MEISYLIDAIKKSWDMETCYHKNRNRWDVINPSFGQCAVTALVVQDYFGGELIFCSHYNNYWNKLGNG